jgi:DNA invertase Pin-like site-specific DNA recombinase
MNLSTRRAAIYVRTASASPNDAMSLEAQHGRCLMYAQEHGDGVVATFKDVGCTGASLNRPGLRDLRELAQRGAIDVVLVLGAERLARDCVDQTMLMQEFAQAGVAVQIVNAEQEDRTPAYRLPMAVAQFNHDQLVRRLAARPADAHELRRAGAAHLYTVHQGWSGGAAFGRGNCGAVESGNRRADAPYRALRTGSQVQ